MPVKYDVQFINPFLHAVIDVLQTMAQVQASPGKPFVNTNRTAVGDVTGLIGITGYAKGTMSLSVSETAILQIVTNMLGEEFTEINEEIADAVGELTNMIAGQARGHLSAVGMTFQASTPTVVVGKGHKINHVGSGAVLAIPFNTAFGGLVVEVSFTSSEDIDTDLEEKGEAVAKNAEPAAESTEASDQKKDGAEMDDSELEELYKL